MSDKDLQDRIRSEMVANYSNALERNFEVAKQMIKITTEGKVDVLVKDKLSSRDNIVLYLIGKRYARTASLAPSEYVTIEELLNELGMKEGTLFPTLKLLREEKVIEYGPKEGKLVTHAVSVNMVETELKAIMARLRKSGWPVSSHQE